MRKKTGKPCQEYSSERSYRAYKATFIHGHSKIPTLIHLSKLVLHGALRGLVYFKAFCLVIATDEVAATKVIKGAISSLTCPPSPPSLPPERALCVQVLNLFIPPWETPSLCTQACAKIKMHHHFFPKEVIHSMRMFLATRQQS